MRKGFTVLYALAGGKFESDYRPGQPARSQGLFCVGMVLSGVKN